MQTERNLLIEAYRGAGVEFLASRIMIALATDEQIAAHGHPAVRDYFAREIQQVIGEQLLAELVKDMAAKALMLVKLDIGERNAP